MKICFLSLNSYPLLKRKNYGYAGGAEVEQTHLGTELAYQGHDVWFVTYSYGQKQMENVNGIKIVKTYNREKSKELSFSLKSFYLWSALKKVNAEIYFHEAGSYGLLPLFCSIYRKKFVHRIATDAIVLKKTFKGTNSIVERLINELEIKKADAVIAQSEFQKRLLKDNFNVKATVIRNGLPITKNLCEKPSPPTVLWVGSISEIKNPMLFLRLARSLPHFHFNMVGGRTDDNELYERLAKAGDKVPNFKFHGFVPYYEINNYFERASIFVNTSQIEGFSNTFIQAWAHFCPVISFHDPDGVIQNKKIGIHSGNFKQLVLDVTSLLEDESLRKKMGCNGRSYVEKEHDIRKTVKQYIKTFHEIL